MINAFCRKIMWFLMCLKVSLIYCVHLAVWYPWSRRESLFSISFPSRPNNVPCFWEKDSHPQKPTLFSYLYELVFGVGWSRLSGNLAFQPKPVRAAHCTHDHGAWLEEENTTRYHPQGIWSTGEQLSYRILFYCFNIYFYNFLFGFFGS